MEDKTTKPEKDEVHNVPENRGRRRLLGALVAGGGAAILMPEKWIKPVAEKIVTPAHAQATGLEKVEPQPTEKIDKIDVSDRRLKENIAHVGLDDRTGLSLYEFSYIDKPGVRYRGVMADEVEPLFPQAVVTRPDGMKAVKYGLLGIEFSEVGSVSA